VNGKSWYYCNADVDETSFGPVSLEQLAELIGTGQLPYDVLVSTTDADWEEADTVLQVLEAIPLDKERLIQEYVAHGEAFAGEENWGWASDRMYGLLERIPELAWSLLIEMIDRAPSDASLSFLATSPLEDLLSKDGPDFIARVEERAAENPKFRRALTLLNRLGTSDDVWGSRTSSDG
jgi:hypothetical protein